MQYEWDERKNAANQTKHSVDFNKAEDFQWESALETFDDREDYGEERWIAYGVISNRLYCMVYTHRDEAIRIISLRKANRREVERYEKE